MKFYVLYIVIICVAMIVIIVRINDYYKKDLKMSYRNNSLDKNEIIVQAVFKCKKGIKTKIQNNQLG